MEIFDKVFAGFISLVVIVFISFAGWAYLSALIHVPIQTTMFTLAFVFVWKRVYPRVLKTLKDDF